MLWQHLLKKEAAYIISHTETAIPLTLYKKFLTWQKKRLQGFPIAYLTGHKGFYDLDFSVSPSVLIPRPDSELIIDSVFKEIKELESRDKSLNSKKGVSIIDVGTGSGALIITLSKLIRKKNPRLFKNSHFLGLDISPAALRLAKTNSLSYKLENKISFYKRDLLSKGKYLNEPINKSKAVIITANLPYLTPKQIKASPSIAWEPNLALDGGKDGLKYYRKLFGQLKAYRPEWGRPISLFCEIDPSQKKSSKELALKYFPGLKPEIINDLGCRPRLLKLRIPK